MCHWLTLSRVLLAHIVTCVIGSHRVCVIGSRYVCLNFVSSAYLFCWRRLSYRIERSLFCFSAPSLPEMLCSDQAPLGLAVLPKAPPLSSRLLQMFLDRDHTVTCVARHGVALVMRVSCVHTQLPPHLLSLAASECWCLCWVCVNYPGTALSPRDPALRCWLPARGTGDQWAFA